MPMYKLKLTRTKVSVDTVTVKAEMPENVSYDDIAAWARITYDENAYVPGFQRAYGWREAQETATLLSVDVDLLTDEPSPEMVEPPPAPEIMQPIAVAIDDDEAPF